MNSNILKKPYFWIRTILLTLFSVSLFFYISDLNTTFFKNHRLVDISNVTSFSIQYLWENVYTYNLSILLFITLLILILIIHVIIIYQDDFGKNHGQ